MNKVYLGDGQLSNSIYLMQPSRPVLVTTRNPDGTVNVAPFSWMVPFSMCPPMVGLALLTRPKKQHTLVNVEREGTFVVNVPGLDIAGQMVRTSYRYPEGTDKFAEVDFRQEESRLIDPPGVGQCRAHIECRAVQMLPTGDHTLVIADVVAASYDPELYDENLLLRLDRTAPCVHLRHRKGPEGQTHFFLEPAGVRRLEVPYAGGSDPYTVRCSDDAAAAGGGV